MGRLHSGRAGPMNDQESDTGVAAGLVIAFVLLLMFAGVAVGGGTAIYFYRSAVASQALAAEQRARASAEAARRAAMDRELTINAPDRAEQSEPMPPIEAPAVPSPMD